MNYRNTFQEPAGGKSRDIKTSFFPTKRVPTVQVNVTLVLKKATDSQQAVSRASASQDCARLTSFSWYRPLLGASVGLPFGEGLVGVQVCRQTHFYRSGSEDKRQVEGHWAVHFPFCLFASCLVFPAADGGLSYLE